MKRILIVTTTEGHLSLAKAMESQLRTSYEVEVYVKHAIEIELYKPVYRYFPLLFKIPALAAKYIPQVSAQAHKFSKYNHSDTIHEKIDSYSPDLIICTYFLYNYICHQYSLLHNIPLLIMMANPYSINPIELVPPPAVLLGYDEETENGIHAVSEGEMTIETVGWFVREQFKPVSNKKLVRKKLKLDSEKVTILVTTGSDGSAPVLAFLALLQSVKQPTHIVFICGSNEMLEKVVRKSLIYIQRRNPLLSTSVLGFVDNIHEYIQASDIVIGKAGPNTLFETIACHVPFFAISHISGQEDGNLDLIQKRKLGFVEENPIKAARLIEKIIAHPQMLEKLQPAIQKIAVYNLKSKEKLIHIIRNQLSSKE